MINQQTKRIQQMSGNGITITHTKGNTAIGAIKIEVETDYFGEDDNYNYPTMDTIFEQHRREQLYKASK